MLKLHKQTRWLVETFKNTTNSQGPDENHVLTTANFKKLNLSYTKTDFKPVL